jgi:hypothetical protein
VVTFESCIQPCNRLQDEPLVRRHLCICICVHNAERLSLLMKVEHARAIAITRKDCVKRAHKHNPARTKLFRQSCLYGSRQVAGLQRCQGGRKRAHGARGVSPVSLRDKSGTAVPLHRSSQLLLVRQRRVVQKCMTIANACSDG